MDPVIKKKGGGSNLSTVCTKHGNSGYLKLEDIENSDNYTKITSNYLPYPKITHMYNNCILEFPPPRHSLYGSFDDKPPAGGYRAVHNPRRWSVFCTNEKFLKNCESCEKSLDGIDIYIYKGESSFCSLRCRYWKFIAERDFLKITRMLPIIRPSSTSTTGKAVFYAGVKPPLPGRRE
ncbi:hypothetical protein M9H77_29366 [Catharanthus roseus]|uniref:Uncharacterized protein n=1 Tax=Catharanthus roseus TaxID=4058 RepID=A0ACC0AKS1_CATRO|nr:hypothetical protein M9H77_29366 [Catharanthus roseus]